MSILNRTTQSPDGVFIRYSVSGAAEAALVFIHGGLADRSFWAAQHAAFSGKFKVVSLDLAGHGESGSNRRTWSIASFGADVAAVADAEDLERCILVGNSLGGAVALEAALALGSRTLGVIAVDTFHDLTRHIEPDQAREQAEAWRRDFGGMLEQMLRALFHPNTDPAVVALVRERMSRMAAETVAAMFEGFGGYATAMPARQLRVPLRCINGDLFPTHVQLNQTVLAGFDAVVLPHTGHFPMLECPREFNRALRGFAEWMLMRVP